MVGYRVSVAKFQRPEADATNQPIAYQTRPLNWTFGNPLGAKQAGRGVGRVGTQGGEGGCQKWSVPSGNPGQTYVSGSHRKNLPLAKYHQHHQRSVDDNEISHPPFDAHFLYDPTDFSTHHRQDVSS